MEMTARDLISNEGYEYIPPSSIAAKRGQTQSEYRYNMSLAVPILLMLSIVFFLLGCVIGYQYFHLEATFQRKIDSLDMDMKEMHQRTIDMKKVIIVTNLTLGDAVQKNRQINNALNDRTLKIEETLNNLNLSSNERFGSVKQDTLDRFESIEKEMKNIQQKINHVDNATSFLYGNINVINGNLMHSNGRTQEVIQKLESLNATSLVDRVQSMKKEISDQRTTVQELKTKLDELTNRFTSHIG